MRWPWRDTATHKYKKMGRWKGATSKEYIQEDLACFSTEMSMDMKRKFNFVNFAGNTFYDVT